MNTHNYCIILAGGTGRRLWPTSHRQCPKQFVDFLGTGRTLLQQTFDRTAKLVGEDHIFVSTFSEYHDLVAQQLPELADDHILAEPVQLSTAPAVVWATCHIAMIDADANIVVVPSDQFVANESRFIEQMNLGFHFVSDRDDFLAIGVKPTVPNTAYGYIQRTGAVTDAYTFRVKAFLEKPSPDYARMFVESGEFLWNTGIFLFNAKTLFHLLCTNGLAVGENMDRDHPVSTEEELELVKKAYPASMYTAIDLVILEKCQNVFVRQTDFGWIDLGGWTEILEASAKDANGNAVVGKGKANLSACSNTVVSVGEGVNAIVCGLDNFVVAQEGNRILVCPNGDAQLVRKLVNETQMMLGDEVL